MAWTIAPTAAPCLSPLSRTSVRHVKKLSASRSTARCFMLKLRAEHLLIGRHRRSHTAARRSLSSANDIRHRAARMRPVRRCAHTSHKSRARPMRSRSRRSSIVAPGLGIRQRIALHAPARSRREKAPLVGKVGIERVPLNAGPLGHHAEGGQRRADAAVQLHGGFDDALPGFRLLLGAASSGCRSGSCLFRMHSMCAVILTRSPNFNTHICTIKLTCCPPRSPAGGDAPRTITWRQSWKPGSTRSPTASIRLSTFVPDIAPPAGFTFNQFLVLGDEPLLFHTGLRRMFPLNRDAVSRLIPPERLRWITFGHYRGRRVRRDERVAGDRAAGAGRRTGRPAAWCRSTTWPTAPPRMLQTARRSTSAAASGSATSTRRIRRTAGMPACSTRRSTGTLLCGDLFTQLGDGPALTEGDIVGPAIAAEDLFQYSSLSPGMGTTIRGLAKLSPRTLALMHGPSFSGDGAGRTARSGGRLRPPHVQSGARGRQDRSRLGRGRH